METGVQLPESLEAEVTVLANMINDPDSLDIAFEVIRSEEEFFYEAHKIIFKSMRNIINRGRNVNRVNLVDELKTSLLLEKAGGISYIVSVADSYITGVRTRDLALIVHDKYMYRRLAHISDEIKEMAMSANGDVRDAIATAEDKILNLGLNTESGGLEAIGAILKNTAEEITRRSELKGEISGLSTGFKDLDGMTSGFQKSDLILLAARPSMGKTAIAINFAVAAAQAGRHVAVFSLEMSKEQLGIRIFSQIANINISKLISGDLQGEDWKRLSQAMSVFSSKNFYIDDSSGTTVSDLRSKLRRKKMEDGLDLVLIDYLQLMEAPGGGENRQQEISKISRGLKSLAKELEVPVIALSQLSRGPESRNDKRPMLSDLRESGAIEQDADIVMFLYRDEYYNKDTVDKGIGEVIIAKHRNGPTGAVKLVYKAENTKFLDMSKLQDPFEQ